MRLIDWIWHVRGSVPLTPEQSSESAFDKLDSLFRERGTTHQRDGDRLTFEKKAPAAQDKMSVFDRGVLRVEKGATGPVLRYDLVSRALLFCFLAPLLFLAFAQLTVFVADHESASKPATAKSAKPADEPKAADVPMNPIDKFLGAPEPDKKKSDEEKGGRRSKKLSPTPSYVFAGIFAALYLIGRVLESWLVKRLFARKLTQE